MPKQGEDVYRKINTACLIIIAAVCLTTALIYTRAILIPLVISLFIYTMVIPVIRYMRFKLRLPRWLAVALASFVVIAPLVLLVLFIINSVANFVQVANTYQAKLLLAFNWVIDFLRNYDIPFAPEPYDLQGIASLIKGDQLSIVIKGVSGITLKMVSYSMLVFIFVFFFLIGSGREAIANPLIRQAQDKISAYLFIHIIISLLTGILVGIVYVSAGLELALTFAVLAVILNFIPTIGSIIAVLLPLPIALIQYDGFGPQFWVVLIIPSIIQVTLGSLVEPKLLGSGLDLHPVAIIGSLVFWTLVWGIPGAFLAVPITAAIKLILNQLEPTRPLAEILAGRLPR